MTKVAFYILLQVFLITSLSSAKALLPPHRNQGYHQYRAAGLEWSELELYNVYNLVSDIYYTDSRYRYLLFPKNSPFRMTQIIPIPQISTIYFEYIHQKCPHPTLKLDLFLYENVVLVVEPGCVMGVYVEARDYYYPSFWTLGRSK